MRIFNLVFLLFDSLPIQWEQLFDTVSSTYTYLLADLTTKEAILIDPVLEHAKRDKKLLEEFGFQLKYASKCDSNMFALHGVRCVRCVDRKTIHEKILAFLKRDFRPSQLMSSINFSWFCKNFSEYSHACGSHNGNRLLETIAAGRGECDIAYKWRQG